MQPPCTFIRFLYFCVFLVLRRVFFFYVRIIDSNASQHQVSHHHQETNKENSPASAAGADGGDNGLNESFGEHSENDDVVMEEDELLNDDDEEHADGEMAEHSVEPLSAENGNSFIQFCFRLSSSSLIFGTFASAVVVVRNKDAAISSNKTPKGM